MNYVYFPNVEYLVINCVEETHDSPVLELLSKMKKLKTIFIYFSGLYDYDANPPIQDRPPRFKYEDIWHECLRYRLTNNYEIKRYLYWTKISKKFQ
jgi:S-methylmethionine-dependent homocysteine/selenocysteine methylase